jgi:hypothetical protein
VRAQTTEVLFTKVRAVWLRRRVARWLNFIPKIPIWVNFGGPGFVGIF